MFNITYLVPVHAVFDLFRRILGPCISISLPHPSSVALTLVKWFAWPCIGPA